MAKSKRSKPEMSLPDEKKSEKRYAAELERLQEELAHLQSWVKATGQRIVIIFEGRDAAGKGGIDEPAGTKIGAEAMAVPVPDPAQRDPSDRFLAEQRCDLVIDRVEALGKALHEGNAGVGHDRPDRVAVVEIFPQWLLA